MPRYGLFDTNGDVPAQELEGDYMAHQVCIYRKGALGEPDTQVAAIRLHEGQCVRQMKDSSQRGLEPQSKIVVGLWLLDARETLGEAYPRFRRECAKVFRKSESTLNRYVALAQAVSHRFAASRAIKEALFPIWSAEECFDNGAGELRPVLNEAVKACNGIPGNADSATAEEWARKFVATVDALVRNNRGHYPSPSWLVLHQSKHAEGREGLI